MSYDVIIVGAGPGGLACAERTALHGLKTLVLERKDEIGKKVCGGGITWNGLLNRIPARLHEKTFAKQYIYTRFQKTCVSSSTPIVATINREKLGQHMAQKAQQAGAVIRLGCRATTIKKHKIIFCEASQKKQHQESFSYLVGADGSSSLVRRHLGLSVTDAGVGINYQIAENYPDMQWHLDSSLFSSGYGWVFPHNNTVSIGAYADKRVLSAKVLHNNLIRWAKKQGFPLANTKPAAEIINFDFRGYQFGNIFLVGDAAGLASGLTGEGIYSAIISGETVANLIDDPYYKSIELINIIKNHALHKKLVAFAGKTNILASVLFEILALSLKTKLINFSAIEMSQ